ncbi:MAG: cytochrome c oxidase subunit II [Rhodobacteraceae bacterium]|nr:cytochrome c oxidase subunit II [Paracoccaceae bacterium]
MRLARFVAGIGALAGGVAAGGAVMAQDALDGLETIGRPTADGIAFQPAATMLAENIHWLDNFILWIISAICLFVLALLVIIIVRFNSRVNKTPATFTHNSVIEVIWTLVPVLILIMIGFASLPRLFEQMEIPEADVTIKVTGNQWYWTYEYPDHEFGFDSYMLGHPGTLDGDQAYVLNDEVRALLKAKGYAEDEFLLATDTAVVVPVGKNVVLQITGSDVIHAWTIPAFGVKLDAVPGRLQQTWFNANKEGIYFGQCSELCGKDHAYMPITVKVVSQENYDKWLDGAIEEYAGKPRSIAVASN